MAFLKRMFLIFLIITLIPASDISLVNSYQNINQYSYSLEITGQKGIKVTDISIFQGQSLSSGSIISFTNFFSNDSGTFGSLSITKGTGTNVTGIIKLSEVFFWSFKNTTEWSTYVKNYDSNHQNNSFHYIRYNELSQNVLIYSQINYLAQIIEVNTSTDLTLSIEWFNSSILPINYFLGENINPSDEISLNLVIPPVFSQEQPFREPSNLPIFIYGILVIIFPLLYYYKIILKYLFKLLGVFVD